jgi:hypothetical protein
MPAKYVEFGQSWRVLHPTWEIRLWTSPSARTTQCASRTVDQVKSLQTDFGRTMNLRRMVLATRDPVSPVGKPHEHVAIPHRHHDECVHHATSIGVREPVKWSLIRGG